MHHVLDERMRSDIRIDAPELAGYRVGVGIEQVEGEAVGVLEDRAVRGVVDDLDRRLRGRLHGK